MDWKPDSRHTEVKVASIGGRKLRQTLVLYTLKHSCLDCVLDPWFVHWVQVMVEPEDGAHPRAKYSCRGCTQQRVFCDKSQPACGRLVIQYLLACAASLATLSAGGLRSALFGFRCCRLSLCCEWPTRGRGRPAKLPAAPPIATDADQASAVGAQMSDERQESVPTEGLWSPSPPALPPFLLRRIQASRVLDCNVQLACSVKSPTPCAVASRTRTPKAWRPVSTPPAATITAMPCHGCRPKPMTRPPQPASRSSCPPGLPPQPSSRPTT